MFADSRDPMFSGSHLETGGVKLRLSFTDWLTRDVRFGQRVDDKVIDERGRQWDILGESRSSGHGRQLDLKGRWNDDCSREGQGDGDAQRLDQGSHCQA